ncbi:MAG: peroxide stress protein YaaA [Candidatus Sumerlaeia bacterium]|nr:peroxide stress protein YaaA [Candidatus Sumerlaeia bacterium]
MSDWTLLLPPSEGKAPAPASGPCFEEIRKRASSNSFRELDPMRLQIFDALAEVLERGHGLEKLFDVTGESLQEAIVVNRDISTAPVMVARDLYNGVMFQAIAYSSLKGPEKKLFNNQTVIFSGAFGLVRPADKIPPYKLKMGANLGGAVGKVVTFWKRPVSEILRRELRGKVVWDFLPDQHRRCWDGTGEIVARHQVKFVKRIVRDGIAEYKTISHHSKSLKGSLIRHLLRKNATKPGDLEDFVHEDGYRFNPELSVRNKRASVLVFSAE